MKLALHKNCSGICPSLPSLLILSIVCLSKGINPLNTPFTLIPLMLALPLLAQKSDESFEKAIADQQREFSEMGATEFLNFFNEFRKIPLGELRACYKEAYRRAYLQRYGKDIVNDLPLFGE